MLVRHFFQDLEEGGVKGKFYVSNTEPNVVYKVVGISPNISPTQTNHSEVLRYSYSVNGVSKDMGQKGLLECLYDERAPETFKPQPKEDDDSKST